MSSGPKAATRPDRIFEMWLACHTTDEIAGAVGCGKATVSEVCSEAANLPESNKAAASGEIPRYLTANVRSEPSARRSKAARDRRIFEMWLACHTQAEIADAIGIDQAEISRATKDFMQFGNLADSHKAAASHAIDFDPPEEDGGT